MECTDELLLDGVEQLVDFDIDTTGHWWARTRPYEQFTTLHVDGESFGPFHSVTTPVFSPDGSSWVAVTVLNNRLSLIGTSDILLPPCTGVDHILYPQAGGAPWVVYRVDQASWVTNGSTTFQLVDPTGAYATDPMGMVFYAVVRRGAMQALSRNGADGPLADEQQLGGVWWDGRAVVAARNGTLWSVRIGEMDIRGSARVVSSLTVNPAGTVLAAIIGEAVGARAMMYTDDYTEPWFGPNVDNASGLRLHPTDVMCAYVATNRGATTIYYNASSYPAGTQYGPIVFSHDGTAMVFLGRDDVPFITVNGRRTVVGQGVSTSAVPAVAQAGEYVAYSTSTSMAVWNVGLDHVTIGRMCDRMARTIYDHRQGTYLALGSYGQRLFLLRCRP